MRLTRSQIQEYIDVIYSENKTIVLTAPTGFGRLNVFIKPIIEDLLASPKKCLVVTDTKLKVDHIQENFFNYIESSLCDDKMNIHKVIENRSKTFVHFKNGSVIDYKVANETRGLSTNEYDIMFIDIFQNILIQLNGNIKYLFDGSKKVIVIEDSLTHLHNMGDYPSNSIKKMVKNYNPFYAMNFNKYHDIVLELRRMKLKKIGIKCTY